MRACACMPVYMRACACIRACVCVLTCVPESGCVPFAVCSTSLASPVASSFFRRPGCWENFARRAFFMMPTFTVSQSDRSGYERDPPWRSKELYNEVSGYKSCNKKKHQKKGKKKNKKITKNQTIQQTINKYQQSKQSTFPFYFLFKCLLPIRFASVADSATRIASSCSVPLNFMAVIIKMK